MLLCMRGDLGKNFNNWPSNEKRKDFGKQVLLMQKSTRINWPYSHQLWVVLEPLVSGFLFIGCYGKTVGIKVWRVLGDEEDGGTFDLS